MNLKIIYKLIHVSRVSLTPNEVRLTQGVNAIEHKPFSDDITSADCSQ